MRTIAHAVHVAAWALAYGSLTYTYYRLNEQMRHLTQSDDEYESFAAAASGGLHWWLFGSLALAGVTGLAQTMWRPRGDMPGAWWALVAVKTLLLFGLAGIFDVIVVEKAGEAGIVHRDGAELLPAGQGAGNPVGRNRHILDLALLHLRPELGIGDGRSGGRGRAVEHGHEEEQGDDDARPNHRALDPGIALRFLVVVHVTLFHPAR